MNNQTLKEINAELLEACKLTLRSWHIEEKEKPKTKKFIQQAINKAEKGV